MNTILQKCLDELGLDNPKIDYVRGMLETVLAMSPSDGKAPVPKPVVVKAPEVIEGLPMPNVELIKKIAESSIE